jgi:hypothetical protein
MYQTDLQQLSSVGNPIVKDHNIWMIKRLWHIVANLNLGNRLVDGVPQIQSSAAETIGGGGG